ncbi:hypothetical protein RCL_jg19498.t2 [Rhizophagus clarus]|nr:hypothetical protein RCL_jg19498.t2 [Rhizophagus clarus]
MEETTNFPNNKVTVINQLQQEPELLIIEKNKENTNSLNNQKFGINDSIHATPMNVDQQSHDQQTTIEHNKKFHMIVDPLTEISDENENIVSNTSIKGKNKEQNEINTTTEIEIININNNENNLSEEFRAFTLKNILKLIQINKYTHV